MNNVPNQFMFETPPQRICILRLSAIGDICHTLPVVRTLQSHWPTTQITWIIGKTEYSLVNDIDAINFVVFDKNQGIKAYHNVFQRLRDKRFDALLHMQMSLRSSVVNRLVHATHRIGFDRARAKDLQWLFNNCEIPAHKSQHVLDSFFGFIEALGVTTKKLCWDIPIPQAARDKAQRLVQSQQPYLVISPCSSMSYRNWHAQGYAQVCDYAFSRHGLRSVLCGGNSQIELTLGHNICQLSEHPPLNLIGKTNLKELLALLQQSVGLVSPDSGPAHMATTVGTPVVGLYACTNPERARPYLSADYVVNKYPQAVQKKYGKTPDELSWGIRVRNPWAMEMITINDVTAKLDLLLSNMK